MHLVKRLCEIGKEQLVEGECLSKLSHFAMSGLVDVNHLDFRDKRVSAGSKNTVTVVIHQPRCGVVIGVITMKLSLQL